MSLTVGDGEAVCLVGRNGAGKTTTIESVMGLLPVRAGRVALRGQDITRLPAYRRARLGIGYSPEDAGIFPDLSVEENFQISTWLADTRPREAGGRHLRADLRPLPRGEAVPGPARALPVRGAEEDGRHRPGAHPVAVVLLLDEPFEGLAPVVVTRFIEAVKSIKAMGISLLIAESNLVNAARIADRLYAIDRGEIIFEGAPRSALANEEVMKTLRG